MLCEQWLSCESGPSFQRQTKCLWQWQWVLLPNARRSRSTLFGLRFVRSSSTRSYFFASCSEAQEWQKPWPRLCWMSWSSSAELVRRVTFPKPGWGPAGSGSTPDIRPWTEWFVPFPSYRGAWSCLWCDPALRSCVEEWARTSVPPIVPTALQLALSWSPPVNPVRGLLWTGPVEPARSLAGILCRELFP